MSPLLITLISNTSPFCLGNELLNVASVARCSLGPVSPLLSSYPELLPKQTSCSPRHVLAALHGALYSETFLPAYPFSTRVSSATSMGLGTGAASGTRPFLCVVCLLLCYPNLTEIHEASTACPFHHIHRVPLTGTDPVAALGDFPFPLPPHSRNQVSITKLK